jgi:hypothetical protein
MAGYLKSPFHWFPWFAIKQDAPSVLRLTEVTCIITLRSTFISSAALAYQALESVSIRAGDLQTPWCVVVADCIHREVVGASGKICVGVQRRMRGRKKATEDSRAQMRVPSTGTGPGVI